MNRTIHWILAQIPFFQGKRVTRTVQIHKGFSRDWRMASVFFVRDSDLEKAPRKQIEFDKIRKFWEMGVPLPATVCFAELEREDQCVQVFEFVEGEDGEDALRRLATRINTNWGSGWGLRSKPSTP